MGKRSNKRPSGPGKEDAGCMWGLSNLFGFHQGYLPQKLLPDRKRLSASHSGSKYSRSKSALLTDFEEMKCDGLDARGEAANKGRASVKSLMQEEMSRIHPVEKIQSNEVQRIHSELGLEAHSQNNYKQAGESCKTVPNLVIDDPKDPKSFPRHQSNFRNSRDQSSLDFELGTFVIKFCGDNYKFQEKYMDSNTNNDSCPVSKTEVQKPSNIDISDFRHFEMHSMLQKVLADLADTFHSQKLTGMEQPNAAEQLRESMDLLDILKSNKDILLDHLQDPNSLLLKGIQDHLKSQDGKPSMLQEGACLKEKEVLKEVGSSEKCDGSIHLKLFNKQNGCNIFKKDKKITGNLLNGNDISHALSRIAVLKPSPERVQSDSVATSRRSSCPSYRGLKSLDGESVSSGFSLKEIQRGWRQVIGEDRKERDLSYMDGYLHRAPYGSTDSSYSANQTAGENLTNKTCNGCEQDSQDSAFPRISDKMVEMNLSQKNIKNENISNKADNHIRLNVSATIHPLNRKSFYEEAKKHLVQMIDTRDGNDALPRRQLSKSLGVLLSLPEYNLLSPRASSEGDNGTDLSILRQFRHVNATKCTSQMIHDFEKISFSDCNLDDEDEVIDLDPTLIHSHSKDTCTGELLPQQETAEVVEKDDGACREEYYQLDISSDGYELVGPSTTSQEAGSFRQLALDSYEYKLPEKSSAPIFPSSALVKNTYPENILEKLEEPRPISDPECFSVGDVINNLGLESAKFPKCSQSIHFEEHDNASVVLTTSESETIPMTCSVDKGDRFEYVKAVLEISGLSCKEIPHRWLSSSQLLDPSSFDEIEVSYRQLLDDPKLLFDCICEALAAIQKRHSPPWFSFMKPNARQIPVGANLIQEVCRSIDRHGQWPPPRILDDIVKKDMDVETWLDQTSETNSIVIEMEYGILEELIVETALDMWVELSLCGTIDLLGCCGDSLI